MATTLSTITSWIESGQSHYVCVTGVHGVMESVRDSQLRKIHNQSGLTVPDGMPIVWSAHWAGAQNVQRVAGPDLMLYLARLAANRGWTSFLYGGGEGVADSLAKSLTARFPEFRVVGTFSPPFRDLDPKEDDQIVGLINARDPDIVWVGLSTPKQERWMAAHIDRLDARVIVGVGAAFDINAGLVPRAPTWMQSSGLEWLYRLRVEPKRLWRRYLRNNPEFMLRILLRPPRVQTEGGPETT